jgi:beta-galactosidase
VESDPPRANRTISVFSYPYVPVTFLESYTGQFDEVFARRPSGEAVGFTKQVGKGRVMMLGAALPADTLEDLDVLNQMALQMDCPSLFSLSDWADVRLSRGDRGSFLFANNYQDDPVATAIQLAGEPLFGGNAVCLPARRGLILPLDWQLDDDVLVHYATGEIVGVEREETGLVLQMEPREFVAELSLAGYRCDGATVIEEADGRARVQIQGNDGRIALRKNGSES